MMKKPSGMVSFVLSLSLVFFFVQPTHCTLILYLPFDDATIYTGLCPVIGGSLPSDLLATKSASAQFASTNKVSNDLGSYVNASSTAAAFTIPFSKAIKDTLYPLGYFGQFTISIWININNVSWPAGTQYSLFDTDSTLGPRLAVLKRPTGEFVPFLQARFNGDIANKPRFNDLCVNDIPGTGCPNLIPNRWYHVAGVFDGAAILFYLNGAPLGLPIQTVSSQFDPWVVADTNLRVGGRSDSSGFDGLLDDFRLYDVALTAQQMAELYTNSTTLKSPASLDADPQVPPPIGLEKVGQLLNLSVSGTDWDGSALAGYQWQDFTTACQVLSFETPNAPSTSLSIFGIGQADVAAGGYNTDGLCLSRYFPLNISGTPASLQASPENMTTVYLNEFTAIEAGIVGFPVPSVQWQVSVFRQVLGINGSVFFQQTWIPIPGQTSKRLQLLNTDAAFVGVPSGRRAAGDPIVVRATFQNKFSTLLSTSAITITPLTEVRPEDTSGDGGDGTVAAIVVPVVVGPILLCLLCMLILLVVVLVILARRRRGGEWKPDLTEPDYKALAFGKFLDSPPSVSKKQLAALKKLEELLLDSDYLLTRLLCDNAKATEADNVAKVITYLYAAHGEAVGLVQHFITNEVESSNKEGTLFRANSISSKMFTTYSRVIALEYVWHIFAYPVAELDHMAQVATGEYSSGKNTTIMGPMAMEVDPSKMEEAADEQINTLELWLVAQKLFSGMTKAKSSVPSEVRLLLRHVQTEVAAKFSDQAAHKAMGGFLFLRLLCPSLMAPQVYGLLKEPPNAMAQRQLILIAKVMQNLANDTLPGKKEGYMEKLNEFITSNQERLRTFYNELIAHAEDGPHSRPSVPDSVKTNSLVQLHKFISINYDKLSAVIQQEDEGLAEELQEVMDSIGSIESDEL